MTWSDFIILVKDDLGVDATRRGIDNLRDRSARNAVIDLQRYIRAYRQAHTTTYALGDMAVESQASLGTLPTGAKPKAFYIYSTATGDDPNCRRHRLDFYPWERRQDLICGRMDYSVWCGACGWSPNSQNCQNGWARARWRSKPYVVTISPMGRNFIIYPPLNDATNLLLVWDGLKMDFADSDIVPFPPESAEAVAAYVKRKILLQVDKNVQMAHEYEMMYVRLRLGLFRQEQETQEADGKDEEYTAASTIPPAGGNNSYHAQTNSTGNSEIAPSSGDHIEEITVSGVASTRVFYIDTADRNRGDRCTILAELPVTANIVVELRNATSGGTLLYTYTTDGSGNSAAFELYFDGSAWQPLRVQVPA